MITCKWLLSVYSLVYHMISSLGETLDTMIVWQWFHCGIYFYINCFPPWILLDYMYFYRSSKNDWKWTGLVSKFLVSSSVWPLFLQNSSWVLWAVICFVIRVHKWFKAWWFVIYFKCFCIDLYMLYLRSHQLLPYWRALLTMKWSWPLDKNRLLLSDFFSHCTNN